MASIEFTPIPDKILSICIPTYNRSEILKKSLNSIVSQDAFLNTGKIQIVISDNCSTDDTKIIVDDFIVKYGDKIKYSRTDFNIVDKNIERALSLGDGEFLKLANDTLIHLDGSLDYYLDIIINNRNTKKVLFFGNGLLDFENEISGSGIDLFVQKVSYFSTWIASFGIWKSDYNLISDFDKSSHLHLIQTDNILQLVDIKNDFIITNVKLFDVQDSKNKGGYDIIKVFLENYSFLLIRYVETNKLDKSTFDKEMQIVVKRFLINSIMLTIFYPANFNYLYQNAISKIVIYFREKPFFLVYCLFLTLFLFAKYAIKKVYLKAKVSIAS